MLGVVSEWEREAIGERTAEAMQAKADRGEYTGGKVPFGKRLGDDGVHLEDDPHEQRILALIRELREDGHTYDDVSDELNRRGLERRNGNDWHGKAVSRAQKAAA